MCAKYIPCCRMLLVKPSLCINFSSYLKFREIFILSRQFSKCHKHLAPELRAKGRKHFFFLLECYFFHMEFRSLLIHRMNFASQLLSMPSKFEKRKSSDNLGKPTSDLKRDILKGCDLSLHQIAST